MDKDSDRGQRGPLWLILPILVTAWGLLASCDEVSPSQPAPEPAPVFRVAALADQVAPTPMPRIPVLLGSEFAYWQETTPLIEEAALKAGTPLAQVYMNLYSELQAGDPGAWDQFIRSAERALPSYEDVLNRWLTIHPPGGRSEELHLAYEQAWGERVASLVLMIVGWESDDPDALELGLATWESASQMGLKAQALRREFNKSLSEQCQVHREACDNATMPSARAPAAPAPAAATPTPTPRPARTVTPRGQLRTYINEEYGYGISVMSGWAVNDSEKDAVVVGSGEPDGAWLVIFSESIPTNYTLESYTNSWVELRRDQPHILFEVVSRIKMSLPSGLIAMRVMYERQSEGQCVGKSSELYVVVGSRGYALAGYACEDDVGIADIEAMQSSFVVMSSAAVATPRPTATPTATPIPDACVEVDQLSQKLNRSSGLYKVVVTGTVTNVCDVDIRVKVTSTTYVDKKRVIGVSPDSFDNRHFLNPGEVKVVNLSYYLAIEPPSGTAVDLRAKVY